MLWALFAMLCSYLCVPSMCCLIRMFDSNVYFLRLFTFIHNSNGMLSFIPTPFRTAWLWYGSHSTQSPLKMKSKTFVMPSGRIFMGRAQKSLQRVAHSWHSLCTIAALSRCHWWCEIVKNAKGIFRSLPFTTQWIWFLLQLSSSPMKLLLVPNCDRHKIFESILFTMSLSWPHTLRYTISSTAYAHAQTKFTWCTFPRRSYFWFSSDFVRIRLN